VRLFFLAIFAVGAAFAGFAACQTYDVTYTSDGGPCVALCKGQCTDTTSDRNNCGQCGVVCANNQICGGDAGCEPCPNPNETACGTSGGTFCADLTNDDKNCGACGQACAHGATCVASKCVCTLTTCGTECVDVQTDVDHCGGCNSPCPAPSPNEVELCTSATCTEQCISPFADCDGVPANGCETNLETDSSNCGLCGRSCNGSGCTSGMCALSIYSNGANLTGLAVDSSFVYWAEDATNGVISKEAILGGSPQTVYATATARLLGVDSTRIVWMQLADAIDSRLLSGGIVTQVASFGAGTAMAVFSGNVYYGTSDGNVWRVPTDGSAGATMMGTISFAALSIAVDATTTYFSDTGGHVYSLPDTAQSATPTLIASGQNATHIAIDAVNVYWTAWSGAVGSVASQAKNTINSAKVLVPGQLQQPTAITTDGVSVYWSLADGSVHRVAVDGTNPITLASKQDVPSALAVDSTRVYWTSPTVVEATAK
jgi:hypothetical protein